MANYMAEIAELYGLELGEVFRLTGHKDIYFKFVYDDLLGGASPDTVYHKVEPQDLVDILTGKCKVIKYFSEPKYGETYYVACPTNVMDKYEISHWVGSVVDEELYSRGLIFPTADMAVEATNSIIAMLKGELDSELQVVTHMREVAELFGLELGEAFRITDNVNNAYPKYYRLSKKHGVETSCDNINWEKFSGKLLRLLMLGEVKIEKLPWKPKKNGYYFIPELANPEMFSSLEWLNDNEDKYMYEHGLVCRTEKEAIKKAKLLMEYFKNNCIERNENNG